MGVEINISIELYIFFSCSIVSDMCAFLSVLALIFLPSESRSVSLRICSPSSLVGTRIRPLIPLVAEAEEEEEEEEEEIYDSMGITNAAVFPDPVGALAKTSRLSSKEGIACI